MKKIIIFSAIIISVAASFYLSVKDSCKILKINSPTEIFADTNRNLIFDETVPIITDGIFFIEKDKNYDDDEILSQLTDLEKFFLEYKAKELSSKILKNRFIKFSDNSIIVKGKKYSEILLKSGFFYSYDENSKKALIDKIHGINLDNYYIYNTKSGKVHRLDCPKGRAGRNYKIKKLNLKEAEFNLCGFCFGRKDKYITEPENKIQEKIVSKNFKDVFELENIKIYFLDLNKIFLPSSSCKTSACKGLKEEIDNAKQSIDFAVYGINNQPEIINALINARQRGVKIRWVCDFDKTNANYFSDTEKLKRVIKNYNTDEYYERKNRSAIMHNKFFIFDDKKVWTGSANITSTDLSGFNANYTVLINSPETAWIYKQEFEQMYGNKFHREKDKIVKTEIKINDKTTVIPLFSPKDDIIKYITKEINQAQKYIYIPIFFITNKELSEPLIRAHKRGVDVRIINDATNAHTNYSIHKILRENGIKVKTENYAGKMHMKAVIIDDKLALTGSMNYTKSGNNYNDENVIIIKNNDIAVYLKNTFIYLWNRIPDKYLKIDPNAESYASIGSCSDGIDNDFDGKIDKEDEGCCMVSKYRKSKITGK